jgi:hypothetical protein
MGSAPQRVAGTHGSLRPLLALVAGIIQPKSRGTESEPCAIPVELSERMSDYFCGFSSCLASSACFCNVDRACWAYALRSGL